MKKFIFASLVLICSVLLTIKSNNYMNSLSISFLSNNIEALTEGDYDMDGGELPEAEIYCTEDERGPCWLPEDDWEMQLSIGLPHLWPDCYWTGCTYDLCIPF